MRNFALVSTAVILAIAPGCGGGSMTTTNTTTPPPIVVNGDIAVNNTSAGGFDLALSTSFQPAEWDYQFFLNFPNATVPLGDLRPNHVRLQTVSQGIPQTSATT